MALPTRNDAELHRAPLSLPVDLGSGLQINIYCHTVIIERPHPALPSPPSSQPRKGIWVRTGGVLDFMRTLYQNILDRDPESHAVLEGSTREVYTRGLAYTVGRFFTSPEYTAKGFPTEITVDKFYLSVLGRHPEAEGRAHWAEEIRRGMTLWRVAEKFVDSEEYRRKVEADQVPDPIHWPQFEQ